MAKIIHFDSAGEGKTGKSTIAMNTAATLARDYGKTLIIEASDNPGYISTYSRPAVKNRLFDFNESKNLYSWNSAYLEFAARKQLMKKELNDSDIKSKIMSKIIGEKSISIKTEEDMEKAVEREIDEMAVRAVYDKFGKGKPFVHEHSVKTGIENLSILAGKINQKSMLEELIKSYYPNNFQEIDEMLKKSFARDIKNLSKTDGNDYKYVVIDGRTENDSLSLGLYEAADMNIVVLDNSLKTAQSAYTCLPIKIKQIFKTMTEKNPLFNMLLDKKSGNEIEDFRAAANRAVHISDIISIYESKRAKNEEIIAEEENVYNKFVTARYDLGALINDREKYESLVAPTIITNQIHYPKRALRNAKLLNTKLDKKGITVDFPAPNNGFMMFYNDLMSKEEDKSMPISISNPKHGFSKEIIDFVKYNIYEGGGAGPN